MLKSYTEAEKNLINSLNRPIDNIDEILVNSIVNKMIANKEYEGLIHFFNGLFDFSIVPKSIVYRLLNENNKECISVFLDNEDILYFLSNEEKIKLKDLLNVYEVNIKLKESYDYYYKLLFQHGLRHYKSIKKSDKIIEHLFIKNNILTKIKIKEITDIGIVVSYINYKDYKSSIEEQLLNGIDSINKYGFKIDRKINNENIINIGCDSYDK